MAIIFIIINFHQKNSNVNNLYVHMQSFSVAEFVYPQDPPLPKPWGITSKMYLSQTLFVFFFPFTPESEPNLYHWGVYEEVI